MIKINDPNSSSNNPNVSVLHSHCFLFHSASTWHSVVLNKYQKSQLPMGTKKCRVLVLCLLLVSGIFQGTGEMFLPEVSESQTFCAATEQKEYNDKWL